MELSLKKLFTGCKRFSHSLPEASFSKGPLRVSMAISTAIRLDYFLSLAVVGVSSWTMVEIVVNFFFSHISFR